jgi:hypothetical protein
MLPREYLDELKKQHDLESDTDLADFLNISSGRISQLRSKRKNLNAKQACNLLGSAIDSALENAIQPIVEMYPIQRTASRHDMKWELLPTKNNARNSAIRKYLEDTQGIYILYDSLRCAIYIGRTVDQNIWSEMTSAFNRDRSHHTSFIVNHPTTGAKFVPSLKKPRQPVESVVYLYDTALYFSAYEVVPSLIPKLEALLVRVFCNSLSNKKMEKF